MRTAVYILMTALCWFAAADRAWCQPALERLEKRLEQTDELPPPDEARGARRNGPEPGYLGAITDDRGEAGKGVRIREIVRGAPADDAGLRAGDLIIGIDDQPVRSMDDLATVIQRIPAGGKVRFEVERDRRSATVEVMLGVRPPQQQRRFERFGRVPEEPLGQAGGGQAGDRSPETLLGVVTRPVTEESRRLWKLPTAQGAVVSELISDSPADQAGIPLGAVIVAVDGAPVRDSDGLAELVAQAGPGREIEISFYREQKLTKAVVRLAEDARRPINPQDDAADGPALGEPSDEPITLEPPAGENARIEQLERKIAELERRLAELEQAKLKTEN